MMIVTPDEWNSFRRRTNDTEEGPKYDYTVRAANLGGWLVADESVKQSLFAEYITSNLQDGTKIRIRRLNRHLVAEYGGGSKIVVVDTPEEAKDYGIFTVWRNQNEYHIRVSSGQFIGVDLQSRFQNVVAHSSTPGEWDTFEISRNNSDQTLVQIKAKHGRYLQVNGNNVTADFRGPVNWAETNAYVFRIDIVESFKGEYQLTNALGPQSGQVMNDHWGDFIRQENFREMVRMGINTVKIPVGWWIAEAEGPSSLPSPFVWGSIKALDNAFDWAQENGLDVIISLQAAQGSQNGTPGSAARDGFQEWGRTTESIEKTVKVIDFLAARYANRPCLCAIDLLDKPSAPGVTLESLKKYYTGGYNAVRKYTSNAYVIMSNRLYANSKELIEFARGLPRVAINVHCYNFFKHKSNFSLESELNDLITEDGPLIFIGEWTANRENAPELAGMTREEYNRLIKEKHRILERNTFGWAYHTLKTEEDTEWSLQSRIRSGYTIA